ncbi:MAG: hypothetical protein GX443_19140 [Deltaproteobacteria bacterium]|nr:hypothetical protein [Deltaproteobacteria bacterium]
MSKLLLLFNHTLTGQQSADAVENLGVSGFVNPPESVKALWADIPASPAEIRPFLQPVFDWLDGASEPGDYVLVQGDFGAVFLVVHHALETHRIPVYSTTRREAAEEPGHDGSVQLTHRFRHVRFREYGA